MTFGLSKHGSAEKNTTFSGYRNELVGLVKKPESGYLAPDRARCYLTFVIVSNLSVKLCYERLYFAEIGYVLEWNPIAMFTRRLYK